MNSCYLRKDELVYELDIRGISSDGKVADLRKRLTQAFAKNTKVDEQALKDLDIELELKACRDKYVDFTTLVEEYEGNKKDTDFQRISCRLWHLYSRVERIPTTDLSDEEEEQERVELLAKVKELMDGFAAGDSTETPPAEEVTSNPTTQQRPGYLNMGTGNIEIQKEIMKTEAKNEEDADKTTANEDKTPQVVREQPQTSRMEELKEVGCMSRSKAIPVHKWGLKLDLSTGQSIGSFLQRVEELRRARGVSERELFESAVDLFMGPSLIWYRSTLNRIRSWSELCREMRTVFQSPDYDIRLQREIFNRFQGENEPIDLYLAAMEGLYGRLTTQMSEVDKLRQIMNNMHPHLQDRLALEEINTVEELRCKGRRAEAGRHRANLARNTVLNNPILEPDLACFDRAKRGHGPSGRVATLQTQTYMGKDRRELKCWNCGQVGHRHAVCQLQRKNSVTVVDNKTR